FWWRLSAHGYGLVDDQNNFSPRLGFRVLKFFLHLLGKARFIKRLSSSEVYCFEFHTQDQRIWMAWTDQSAAALLEVDFNQVLECTGAKVTAAAFTGAPLFLLAPLKSGR